MAARGTACRIVIRSGGHDVNVNRCGTPANLIASHPGHANNLQHGYYSTRREITAEVRALADELMSLPHLAETDYAAALEIASLLQLVDRVDAALADSKVEHRGHLRALVDQRRRLSRQLQGWYESFGLTPRSRWELRELARPSVAEAVQARLQAQREQEDNGRR
jgi:hypothetical protein